MSAKPSDPPESVESHSQALVGYRTNAEWNDLVARVGAMVGTLEEMPDPDARSLVMNALQGIDEVHREALHRLVRLFKDGVLEQVITDPAIKTLMGMYDLLPDEARGGARTLDFLTPEERAAGAATPTTPEVTTTAPPELPRWVPAPLERPLQNGDHAMLRFDGHELIVARVRDEDFAIASVCTRHSHAMSGGTLNAYAWICPLGPGCAYDIRNGARTGGGNPLACHPVRRDDRGRLLVGFGMPFKPAMPSF
jgi:nitrite reductase/ring-hydroxylating ferredoxin subunit